MEDLVRTEQRETGEPSAAQYEQAERMPREDAPRKPLARRPHAIGVLLTLGVLAAIGGFLLWQYYSVRESTDNAEIEGHIHPISARVGGTVTAVPVTNDQHVEAGQVLVEIDPTDYKVALARAQADLAETEAALRGSQADLPITTTTTASQLSGAEAGVAEARANLSSSEKEIAASEAKLRAARAKVQENQANYQRAQRDLERMKQLIAKEEISPQQYDANVAAAEAWRATVESSQADVAAAEQALRVVQSHVERDQAKLAQTQAMARSASTGPQQITVTRSRAQSAQARLQMAKAALEQAELNLQYATVRAPLSGEISKKNVETGQIVGPGQPLMAIVPLDEVWVSANFKETQLKNIRVGQPVTVSVDAYGGRKFKAHVDSIASATGAKFSLLPPENATGNFVKVVQRVPVKIVFDQGQDPEHLLRPGMSVEPTVFTK